MQDMDDGLVVNVSSDRVKRRLSDHKIQVDQVEDQDQDWSKMVQEVNGPELPALVSESSSDDEVAPKTKTRRIREEQRDNSRVEELRAMIRRMENDFESLPFRKREVFTRNRA